MSEENKEMIIKASLEELDELAHRYIEIARNINIKCEYCGMESKDNSQITFHRDHIVPRRWGGSDIPENMADACAPCNHSKGDAINMKTLSGRVGHSFLLKFEDGLWHLPSRGL